MKLSHDGRILVVLLLLFVVCGILLTPLGFETRASAVLGNPASLPWLGLGFAGLILIAVSAILLFFRPRIASGLATIGSIASGFLFLADQVGLAVPIRPPTTITAVEVVATVLAAAIVLFAFRVYRGNGVVQGKAM